MNDYLVSSDSDSEMAPFVRLAFSAALREAEAGSATSTRAYAVDGQFDQPIQRVNALLCKLIAWRSNSLHLKSNRSLRGKFSIGRRA